MASPRTPVRRSRAPSWTRRAHASLRCGWPLPARGGGLGAAERRLSARPLLPSRPTSQRRLGSGRVVRPVGVGRGTAHAGCVGDHPSCLRRHRDRDLGASARRELAEVAVDLPGRVHAVRGRAHEGHACGERVEDARVGGGVGPVVCDLDGVGQRRARRDRVGRVRLLERQVRHRPAVAHVDVIAAVDITREQVVRLGCHQGHQPVGAHRPGSDVVVEAVARGVLVGAVHADHLGGTDGQVPHERVADQLAVGVGPARDQIRRERRERDEPAIGADLRVLALPGRLATRAVRAREYGRGGLAVTHEDVHGERRNAGRR